ncbi:MAG: acyl-CoA/acyl-ACP dehydrogenase [Thermoplasmata archaeon]|nr:MAG: acyl-CoA/acyl-ACP dehydrogenase [Thermoplasmata archaeon]
MNIQTFSEEQDLFRESLREFCEQTIVPRRTELEDKKEIPDDIIKAMAEFELLAPSVSPDFGGAGFDAVTAGIAAEELARADPTCSIPVLYLVQCSWGHVFNKFGTEEAKGEILPKVTKGEAICGIATTEADIGSDLGNMVTTIKPTDKGYVINGNKNYISGVREAAKYGGGHVTLARQDLEAGTRGMTMFFFPLKDVPGVTISEDEEMGREAISTGGFIIDNVEIPKHYLIGEENKGFYLVHIGYEYARGLIALVCVGAAMKSIENGIAYIKERKAFGRPIGKYEAIQFALAEHYTRLEMARDFAYKALYYLEKEQSEGKYSRMEVSKIIAMSKLLTPGWAFNAIDDAMQWQGAFGYSRECPDQSALRAIRSFTLAEGSREIMRLIVARELLGKDFIAYK